MIEADEPELPLFTELKKLDPLSRYRASTVAKMAVFHSKISKMISEKITKMEITWPPNHSILDIFQKSALKFR